LDLAHDWASRTKFPLPIEMIGTPKREQVKRSDTSCQVAQAVRVAAKTATARSWLCVLDHDAIKWNRIMISSLYLSMISSENRHPLCANAALRVRIML
jgi:hypothetical protein